jgi:ferredoxin
MFIPPVVCGLCRITMKCEKNGVIAEALSQGRQYYKIECDRYRCPSCEMHVLRGFAKVALAEAYQPQYADIKADVTFELE